MGLQSFLTLIRQFIVTSEADAKATQTWLGRPAPMTIRYLI